MCHLEVEVALGSFHASLIPAPLGISRSFTMKCADLPRRLFQVLPTASHRRSRRRRPAFESFEDKLLLSAFYVAAGGSDSANGSALHPWATIQKAANTVAAGDTVHVAPGNYTTSAYGIRSNTS